MSDDAKDGDLATILTDPAASFWLKAALRPALSRDPVDTAMMRMYWSIDAAVF